MVCKDGSSFVVEMLNDYRNGLHTAISSELPFDGEALPSAFF
jgi:hypothetical protein